MNGMNDIFGYKRNPKPDGVFSTEDSVMTIGSASEASTPLLIQNWNVAYNQQVQELFEIGSNRLYWQKGRPEGQGSIGRVVGADAGGNFMPQEAFDICDGGATMVIKAVGGHCDSGVTGSDLGKLNHGVRLILQGVVVTTIGFSMSVQDVRLLENYAWRFAHMKKDHIRESPPA